MINSGMNSTQVPCPNDRNPYLLIVIQFDSSVICVRNSGDVLIFGISEF